MPEERKLNGREFHEALSARAPFVNDLVNHACEEGVNYGPQVYVGDSVEVDQEGGKDLEEVLVVDIIDGHAVVQHGEERLATKKADYVYVLKSPTADAIWEKHQKSNTPDGVAWGDGLLSTELSQRLMREVDHLAQESPVDYHPGSGGVVRDLVHPSLYSYVEGHTKLRDGISRIAPPRDETHDRWGRPYEESRFQWLPTELQVEASGKARFEGYINNLDQDQFGGLYTSLAELFSLALPLLESVYGFAKSLDPWVPRDDDDCEADLPEPDELESPVVVEPASLGERPLQVITKIVDYEIEGSTSFDGVWHVEGMSHENILATAVCVLDRDENLSGGDLCFKRIYSREEAGCVFWNMPQIRTGPVDEMVQEGVIPLGTLQTPKGRLLAFPNSHIHKLTSMTSRDGNVARRRIIVFWLIDPEKRILSTREVAQQQGGGREDAEAHRLALMEERRLHKQSLNIREISLCEH